VNIKGVLYGIAAALPYMKQQKAGYDRPALAGYLAVCLRGTGRWGDSAVASLAAALVALGLPAQAQCWIVYTL
jgi:hypothetical protein